MYQGSEVELKNIYHLNESNDGVIFKLKKTLGNKNGKFRKTSLDELPQLFNIIFGYDDRELSPTNRDGS